MRNVFSDDFWIFWLVANPEMKSGILKLDTYIDIIISSDMLVKSGSIYYYYFVLNLFFCKK